MKERTTKNSGPSRKGPRTTAQKLAAARLTVIWMDYKKVINDITYEQAAPLMGFSPASFGHYLSGYNAIGFEQMFKLADFLGVHPYDIDPTFSQRLPGDLRAVVDTLVPGTKNYAAASSRAASGNSIMESPDALKNKRLNDLRAKLDRLR